LRRRVGRRLQPARGRPRRLPGLHRRPSRRRLGTSKLSSRAGRVSAAPTQLRSLSGTLRLLLRPDRLGDGDRRPTDRDRHAVLPLHENEKRAAAASVTARVNELSQQPARATSEPSRADQVGTSAAGGDKPDHRRISLDPRGKSADYVACSIIGGALNRPQGVPGLLSCLRSSDRRRKEPTGPIDRPRLSWHGAAKVKV
jgi:hypothetical protein